ncbi:hypothetical protein V6N11_077308 [Hibiscus sabdariffa]|uniref:Uncharacterized protein n=1 Tax=Hibiscus sabdariffa TaxID=183260 RepID=A0ABR2TCQ0_9ROSI
MDAYCIKVLLRLQSLDIALKNHKLNMSSLEGRGPSLRGYRRRKAVLDLNVPPSETRELEGTSQQAGYEEQTIQSVQLGPPATIDVEAIDDDVIESSARAFAEAQNNSRRSRGRTVVDVDSVHISPLPGWSSTHNNLNRLVINLESSVQSVVEEIIKPQPPAKEPTFNCPICMGPLTEEMSTRWSSFHRPLEHELGIMQTHCPWTEDNEWELILGFLTRVVSKLCFGLGDDLPYSIHQHSVQLHC